MGVGVGGGGGEGTVSVRSKSISDNEINDGTLIVVSTGVCVCV